ncbi:MAG: hypothetical protein ACSHYF_03615 [Verrucomicrobiaceae bacterium]
MSRSLLTRAVLATAVVPFLITSQGAFGQVDDWFFDKGVTYRQSADNTQPTEPHVWSVEIGVATLNPGDASSISVSGGGIVGSLALEFSDGEWELYEEFTSEAAMNGTFPSSASYTLTLSGGTLGTITQSFTVGAASYPNIPYLTGIDYSASQNVQAASGNTFHWNAPGANVTGLSLEVEDPISGGDVIEFEHESAPFSTSETISPANLNSGYAYTGYLVFFNTSEVSGSGGFGVEGYVDHTSSLSFDFQTLLASAPDEIVGAWQFGDASGEDSGLLVFQANGTYFHIEDPAPGSDGQDGMEMGTYSLSEAGGLTVNVLVDTNGDIGLSHPNGSDVFTISGDSLTITDNDESSVLTRVAFDPADPIVGAWRICDNAGANTGVLVFLNDGNYFHAEVTDGEFPSGMERGTYSLNEVTGVLTAAPVTDTNGESGLSDPLIGYDEVAITGVVSLRISDGEDFFLHRVSNASVLPDWRINKGRTYTQTVADTAPTATRFWDLWTLVETRNPLDAANVTISGGNLASPRALNHEGEGEWTYEKDYATQAALNAEFPDAQSYTLIVSGGGLGTRIQTINIGSENFPPVPYLTGTNFTDAQNIDSSSDFDFIWNAPENSTTQLILTSEPDEEGVEYFELRDFSGTSTGVTVTGGILSAGLNGYGYLEFSRSSASETGLGGFGVSGFSGRQSITSDFTFGTLGGGVDFSDAIGTSGLTGDDALPEAVPFNDGVSNLLKFAFGMDLTSADKSSLTPGTGTAGLPVFALVDDGGSPVFELEFVRRIGSGLQYTAQRSTSLDGFSDMTGAVTVTPINGEFERVKVTEPCDPAVVPRCFGRVLVTAP